MIAIILSQYSGFVAQQEITGTLLYEKMQWKTVLLNCLVYSGQSQLHQLILDFNIKKNCTFLKN